MQPFEALIPISFFACIVLCVFFISKYRSETITKLGGPIPKSPRNKNAWKRVGIVIIGLAIGLLLSGVLFATNVLLDDNDWTGFIVMGLLSLTVGLSLIIADKQTEQDEQNIDG